MVPRDVVTLQLEHIPNMCTIASIMQGPTNPTEANAINYTVNMDGLRVPYRYASITSTSGVRHSALLHNSNCGTAHRINISANNMCGQSPSTTQIVLDPEQRIVLSVNSPNSAKNSTNECEFVY